MRKEKIENEKKKEHLHDILIVGGRDDPRDFFMIMKSSKKNCKEKPWW